jgi:hypothetical protein
MGKGVAAASSLPCFVECGIVQVRVGELAAKLSCWSFSARFVRSAMDDFEMLLDSTLVPTYVWR